MTTDALNLHAAAAALVDVAGGDADAWARVPVPLRAALAAVALAASARSVNGVTLANAGRYSRGTASRTDSPWQQLITALADNSQVLVDLLLNEASDGADPARLAADIARRDRTIADLRGRLATATAAVQPIADYAHDLAVELRRHRDDERAALSAKLVQLRTVE
ncbi:MAG: hypothetical protein M3011_02510 [Actinomycetota bacterium]|nr:hypothetical protein [Actinomycetota bacterium]